MRIPETWAAGNSSLIAAAVREPFVDPYVVDLGRG
ncbi:hypothetical protein BRAS3843_860034 [Bradyrhizobium sp. STM 3843]|nr:hypothetical protein BRAS3843_860034 [Bradyrhizobium sp. STM 3843]